MTDAEVIAYQCGARFAREAQQLIAAGHGKDMPDHPFLTGEENASLSKLGWRTWADWFRQGGLAQLSQ